MKNLHTFEEFLNESLNEAKTDAISDNGTLKTKLGNLKYVVKGGLDRGGDRGSYMIPEDKLSKLIGSIDMKLISKILGDNGIELDVRPSEFELILTNSGLGYNGLSAIRPEITLPVKLSKDWPEKKNGWATSKEEYVIYDKLNKELEAVKSKLYWIKFSNENNPGYGFSINPKDPKISITFQDGSLS
jgi:hypothetical protein